mgnify:CR=1 FL=1
MHRLDRRYDVLVVGAGPVGIYASLKLAAQGLRVLVVEEDAQIGKPRFCTGLISKDAFEEFHLPKKAIENEFRSFCIFSPSGLSLRLKDKTYVCATDRTVFDQSLYCLAKDAGVKFLLNCRCGMLKINNDGIEARVVLNGRDAIINAEMGILATGVKYALHKDVGFTLPPNFLDSSQVQLEGESGNEIEIYLGNSVAPHSFAWVVPLKRNQLRVGLGTHRNSPLFLKSLLKKLRLEGRTKGGELAIKRRPIPLGTIRSTYAERIVAVGDAAGQVKPTTGGGIYFGLLCADLAAKTIVSAFKKNDFGKNFLRRYEISWRKNIEFDLTMGLYLRKLVARINDAQMEELFSFCSQDPIRELIEKYWDFNHQGKFINELIKRPEFWKSIYRMFTVK